MDLSDYIYDECQRQHVGNYGDFARAHRICAESINAEWMHNTATAFGASVCRLAAAVEPEVNKITNWLKPELNLRSTPVAFFEGGNAAHPTDVYPRFTTLMAHGIEILKEVQLGEVDDPESLVNLWIKTMLDIHPWADGNGRTASLLRNKILGTLDDPTPLPHFYGSN